MVKLTAFIEIKLDERVPSLSRLLRNLSEDWKGESWALDLRATALVLADLIDQGWTVTPADNRIHLAKIRDLGKSETRRGVQVGRYNTHEFKKSSRTRGYLHWAIVCDRCGCDCSKRGRI